MARYNEEVEFDCDNINPVDIRLLDKQVDLLLRALELYVYNLDYMINCEGVEDEERYKKIAMVKYTYEQVLSAKAEQVNAKSNETNNDNKVTIGRKILESENFLKIIPDNRESAAV